MKIYPEFEVPNDELCNGCSYLRTSNQDYAKVGVCDLFGEDLIEVRHLMFKKDTQCSNASTAKPTRLS